MKFRLLICLLAFAWIHSFAFSQKHLWSIAMGSPAEDLSSSVRVDPSGNVYMVGSLRDTVDMDPGSGIAVLQSAGETDIFAAKYDSAGNFVWAFNVGSTGFDNCHEFAIDGSGNLYLTGSFKQTVDFDPGPGTVNRSAFGFSNDFFVAKYDPQGNLVWVIAPGGSGNNLGWGIDVDGQGNVFVAGVFLDSLDFDPGPGTAMRIAAGSSDAFLAKYTSAGNFAWAIPFGSTTADGARSVVVDDSGRVVVAGYFQGTIDLDPGTGTLNISSSGANDIFLAAYDNSGNLQWGHALGGPGGEYPYAVTTDPAGNLFLGGTFQNTLDLDPGPGNNLATSAGGLDAFVVKFNGAGNHLWGFPLGTAGAEFVFGLATDTAGNLFVAGQFENTCDFDPSPSTAAISASDKDLFLARYDGGGNYVWAIGLGGSSADYASQVDVDPQGNPLITGGFRNTVDFDPASGIASHTAVGSADMFLAKYSRTCTPADNPVIQASGGSLCMGDSALLSVVGGNLNDADQWSWYLGGCGGAFAGNGASLVVSPMADSWYFARGEGGCIDLGGCDSLFLQVNPSFSVLDSAEICSGDSILLGGAFQSATGDYLDSLLTVEGCDSLVTTHLSVLPVDVSLSLAGQTLIANAASATYQWISCSTGMPISGANGQSYTPTSTDSIAVVVTQNGCTDTSDCVLVVVVGLEDGWASRFKVFPNPTESRLTVECEALGGTSRLRLRDLAGREVRSGQLLGAERLDWNLSSLRPGMYLLEIEAEGKRFSLKVIKTD